MALPLGKLTILIGAGLIGSVLAKEERLPGFSDLVSGALKLAKLIKRDDSAPQVRKLPSDNSLMDQVNSLRQELSMLASNRPVTIITATGTGASKYGIVVVIVVLGYGYVWWKGWKISDMMFATRRSLSDASNSIGLQLESLYESIRNTRKQLSSNIDRVDSNLAEISQLTSDTQERVIELRDESQRIGNDFRYVRDAVETLEQKLSRIEGKQDVLGRGVLRLVDQTMSMRENNLLEENMQTASSSSRITYSAEHVPLLPSPSPSVEPSSPHSSGSYEVRQPQNDGVSISGRQRSPGISGLVDVSSSSRISNGVRAPEESNNGSSSWLSPAFLSRTRSAANAVVLQRMGSSRQQV